MGPFRRLVHYLSTYRGKARRNDRTVISSGALGVNLMMVPSLGCKSDQVLTDDRLDGAGQIAAFYYGSDTRDNRKKAYRLKSMGAPIGKRGRNIVSSRQALKAWDDGRLEAE